MLGLLVNLRHVRGGAGVVGGAWTLCSREAGILLEGNGRE